MAVPPLATYRVQLRPDFGYRDAADVLDLVAGLGCSHLYISPPFAAREGSAHGYDVTDPTALRDELGGEAGFDHLVGAARAAGLGLVVDIVPNHMAADPENRWWRDVLEHGRASRFSGMFDIDWEPVEERLRHKVVLPILGDHYGRELEAGRIRLTFVDGWFEVRYFEHLMPVAPESMATLIRAVADQSGDETVAFVADELAALPADPFTRHRAVTILQRLWQERLTADSRVADRTAALVDELNGDHDGLDRLLDAQHHRMVRWRASSDELVHRRFFDVSELVAVRQEDPDVFSTTHALLADWVAGGIVDGIRVDHVDGLREPARYVDWLRRLAPDQWIVAEKILEAGEQVPSGWPVDGTTGYDFGRDVTAVLVDGAGCSVLDSLQHDLGVKGGWEETVVAAKTEVLHDILGTDLGRLTECFVRVCENHRRHRDHTRPELRRALAGALVHLDVYRVYVFGSGQRGTDEDCRRIDAAVKGAVAADPRLDDELLGFLGDVLRGEVDGPDAEELRARFEQLSAPAMAKGVEDTALYRWAPSLAMAEVGMAPGGTEIDVVTFHERVRERMRRFPASMLSTSTHDSKRSEDVRARLAVLTEVADDWRSQVLVWHENHATPGCPDPFTEHLLYQILVGAHPLDAERLHGYLTKVMREAKRQTSWLRPDPAHEEAVITFADHLLADETFLGELDAWVDRVLVPGRVNALAQKLLCLTCPGVPDLYQGTDLWNLSLVDPDNRRPIEWAMHRRVLAAATAESAAPTLTDPGDPGTVKQYVVRRALAARAVVPEAFAPGAPYLPLAAVGSGSDRVVAFSRDAAVVAVPRLPLSTTQSARESTSIQLPPGPWFDAFTGADHSGEVSLDELWADFPVALLLKQPVDR